MLANAMRAPRAVCKSALRAPTKRLDNAASPLSETTCRAAPLTAACQDEDQESRSPAKSPVRHIKRPRHAALTMEDASEATSQPSQSQSGAGAGACDGGGGGAGRSQGDAAGPRQQQTQSGCTFSLPPVPGPPRGKSRFARPHSPATFKNPFLTGGDADQQHRIDSAMPKPLPLITCLQ